MKKIKLNEDGTAEFTINTVGKRTNQTYIGKFKVTCTPTPLQIIAADSEYRRLLGQNPAFASETVSNLAFALSQLQQRVLKSPPFWDDGDTFPAGGQIKDIEVINEILDLALEAEIEFKDKLEQETAENLKIIKKQLINIEKDIKSKKKKQEEKELEGEEIELEKEIKDAE